MALFVVQHRHPAERCPATDPQMAPMLLQLLSAQNADRHGVSVRAEAVVDGAHTLYLIADAPSAETLRAMLAPFAQVGSLDVMPASPCEAVIERGGCAVA